MWHCQGLISIKENRQETLGRYKLRNNNPESGIVSNNWGLVGGLVPSNIVSVGTIIRQRKLSDSAIVIWDTLPNVLNTNPFSAQNCPGFASKHIEYVRLMAGQRSGQSMHAHTLWTLAKPLAMSSYAFVSLNPDMDFWSQHPSSHPSSDAFQNLLNLTYIYIISQPQHHPKPQGEVKFPSVQTPSDDADPCPQAHPSTHFMYGTGPSFSSGLKKCTADW
jgi:hypothetical protein